LGRSIRSRTWVRSLHLPPCVSHTPTPSLGLENESADSCRRHRRRHLVVRIRAAARSRDDPVPAGRRRAPLDLAGGRGPTIATGGALRAGLGERLGGQSELLPASVARPARAAARRLRRGSPQRRRALEVGASGGVRQGPGVGLDRRQLRPELLRLGPVAPGADAAGGHGAPARSRGGPRRRLERLGQLSRLLAVTGFWPIFFLLVVLKIPVLGSIWLVWWASQATPEPDGATEDSDGGFKRRPRPKLPRGPRRGPHGGGAAVLPACPPGGRTRGARPAVRPAFARAGSHAGKGESRPRRYDA